MVEHCGHHAKHCCSAQDTFYSLEHKDLDDGAWQQFIKYDYLCLSSSPVRVHTMYEGSVLDLVSIPAAALRCITFPLSLSLFL